ncbi:MAG: prohibitin family protein, partial [Terriglobales bacterium]
MANFEYRSDRVVDVGGGAIVRLLGAGLVSLFLVILLWASVAQVPAGHVGVLTLFGRVTGDELPEGIHLVNPFKVNNTMSVRTQEMKETASVPSSEGLIVNLDTSLLFRLQADRASDVFQKIGPNYMSVVIEPMLRSSIRSVTAAHSANALYSSAREEVAQQIRKELEIELSKRGVVVENVLLRDIQLPPALKASIETK